MADSIEQLSCDLIMRALAEQERSLSGLRTCAGIVLAAASIANSIPATGDDHAQLGMWGLLAVASFALCTASAIWVLIPHGFVFALGGEAILETDAHGRSRGMIETYRAVNTWSRPYLRANSDRLARLSGWLTASGLLLGIEIVLWAINVIG
jgi:hypothetical protein